MRCQSYDLMVDAFGQGDLVRNAHAADHVSERFGHFW